MNAPRIERLGDGALLLRLGERIDAELNRRVHAWTAALSADPPPWLVEIVPAYASLALHVECARIDADDPLAVAQEWVEQRLVRYSQVERAETSRLVEIPVRYGGEDGPDLAELAAHAGFSVAATIARHTASEYTVAMLGFAPGFPYLLGLDAALAMPRRSAPRTRVAAGSVGIGGSQTGVYPSAGPGGWRLIGRTPLRLFDAARDPPCLLRAGDRVRFVAIDPAVSEALRGPTP